MFQVPLLVLLDVVGYQIVYDGGGTFSFEFAYLYNLIVFIITVGCQRIFYGKIFWRFLPFGNTLFIFLAFFLPVPFLVGFDWILYIPGWDERFVRITFLIAVVGIQALWLGFTLGQALFANIKPPFNMGGINKLSVRILLFAYIIAVFISIATGTYGIVDVGDTENAAKYGQYLLLGRQIGLVGLICLVYYHLDTSKKELLFFTALFFILGILSGRKSYALYPVIAVAITYVAVHGRVPKIWVALSGVAFVVAFVVVTTFREVYKLTDRKGFDSSGELMSTYSGAITSENVNDVYTNWGIAQQLFQRLYYGNQVSQMIQYTNSHGHGVPEASSPAHIWLAPVYAVAPRFIYPNKPHSKLGHWVVKAIYGYESETYSIGLTQNGYAYVAGGWIGLVWILGVIGLFLALVHKFLFAHFQVVYLYIYIWNIIPGGVAWAYISNLTQLVVVLVTILFILNLKSRLPKMAYQTQ